MYTSFSSNWILSVALQSINSAVCSCTILQFCSFNVLLWNSQMFARKTRLENMNPVSLTLLWGCDFFAVSSLFISIQPMFLWLNCLKSTKLFTRTQTSSYIQPLNFALKLQQNDEFNFKMWGWKVLDYFISQKKKKYCSCFQYRAALSWIPQ